VAALGLALVQRFGPVFLTWAISFASCLRNSLRALPFILSMRPPKPSRMASRSTLFCRASRARLMNPTTTAPASDASDPATARG
jgi:hypothetical protein